MPRLARRALLVYCTKSLRIDVTVVTIVAVLHHQPRRRKWLGDRNRSCRPVENAPPI